MLGFFLSLLLTPVARKLALRWNVIDRPMGLKIHKLPTPLMGGVAVYIAFALAAVTVLPMSKPVVGVLVGGFVAIVVGVLDEVFTLPPLAHLGGQTAAALAAILSGLGVVGSLSVPFAALNQPGWQLPSAVGLAFTLFLLVGMMNTMNFLDGLDGLATGVAAVAALLLGAWASEGHPYIPPTVHHEDLLLPMALAGALLGFLPYNWHLAKIFLGDSGSMFAGFALGALVIVGPTKFGTVLLVLLVPILDVAWAIVRRQLSGRSFLAGDKQHVYHRMIELGAGYTSTVLILYFLCVALGVLDLGVSKVTRLIAFLVFAAVMGTAFVLLELRASQRGSAESINPEEPGEESNPPRDGIDDPLLA